MKSLMRAVFAALALLIAPTPGFAQSAHDLSGWWRAEISHGGETEPFYFHFDRNDEGVLRARLTIPVARMYEVPAGRYELEGDELRLPGFGLTFHVTDEGRAIDGVFTPGFVSTMDVPVHFVRADTPPTPPVAPTPQGAAPTPAWTVSVGAPVWGGLVADGQRALFVAAEDGRVTALSPRNGGQLWQSSLGSPIHATPTLRGRRLYVATDAALVALDARNGREVWRFAFGAERAPRLPVTDPNAKWDHYSSSAVVDDRLAVVGSRDGCAYALDVRTGAERWRSCTEDLVTATPALTRDAVYYAGYDHRVYAVARADGHELWRYDAHEVVSRDVVLAGDNVVVGSRSYDLIALNARTGAPAWTRFVWYSWIDSPPVYADGRLYTGTSDAVTVFAFDATTGARIWSAPVPGWTWPRLAVGRDTIYASVVGGRYSAPRAGGFAAIDRATGAYLWLFTNGEPSEELYGFASAPVIAGRRVFAADLRGLVYAFDTPRR